MGGKGILVLLFLALGLGAVLWFTDKKPPIENVAQTAVLDGRSLIDSVRIRWTFRERAPIEIGRAPDGRFQIQEPIVDIASSAYLKQIVDTWDSAQMRATPLQDDEAGRAEAGLTSPELVFIVEWPDDARIEIEVGDPGPLGTSRFLRRDGKIWESYQDGGEALIASMQVGLEDLRERTVFRNAFSQANEVRVEQLLPSGKREALHVKQEGGEWQLLEPITGRADPRAAQKFLTAVLGLRVDHFPPGLLRLPDTEPALVLTVRGLAGEETVRLWEEEGQVYGQLPDRNISFLSDNRQYSSIFVNAAQELRARILVPMGENTFEQLVELIVDPGQGRGDRIRLVRDSADSEWRLVEPIEFAVRATPVNEAAYALQRLVAQEFVTDTGGPRPRADDARFGLKGERWTVSTRRLRQQEVNTLWFGADAPSATEASVYVCRADEPDNVAIVNKELLTTLQRPWTEYVERQVVHQPAILERLDLSHQDGRQRVYLIEGDQWVLQGVEGARPEIGEFANDELRDLVGKQAVDMRPPPVGEKHWGEPDWQVVLKRRSGDELGMILLWDRGEEQPLVAKGRSTQPVGFELGTRVSRELRALWR